MTTVSTMQSEAMQVTEFFRGRAILARIVGGFAAPSFFVYRLEIAPSQKFGDITRSLDDLQRVIYNWRVRNGLMDPHDPRSVVQVRAQQQPPVIEVSRPQVQVLSLNDCAWQPQPGRALAGMAYGTKAGQPVVWDLTDPGQPHALVAGMSGSGKSRMMLSLVCTLAKGTSPENLSIVVVDGGNSTLKLLTELKHCGGFAGDADSAIEMIASVVRMVIDRRRRSDTSIQHRVLLVVDELANLLMVLDNQASKRMQTDLATIAAEGRKFGIHLLVGTQKPLAEVTGNLTKGNMAVRFVGAVTSWQDAQTAAGVPGTGAERLIGRGDFIMRNGMLTLRFQAPYVMLSTPRLVNAGWRGVDAAPLHAGPEHRRTPDKPGYSPVMQPVTETAETAPEPVIAPVITGSDPILAENWPIRRCPVHAVTGSEPVTFPLDRTRPPTDVEAAALRELYARTSSKNAVLRIAYNGKNDKLMGYVNLALGGG